MAKLWLYECHFETLCAVCAHFTYFIKVGVTSLVGGYDILEADVTLSSEPAPSDWEEARAAENTS